MLSEWAWNMFIFWEWLFLIWVLSWPFKERDELRRVVISLAGEDRKEGVESFLETVITFDCCICWFWGDREMLRGLNGCWIITCLESKLELFWFLVGWYIDIKFCCCSICLTLALTWWKLIFDWIGTVYLLPFLLLFAGWNPLKFKLFFEFALSISS